MRRYDGWSPCSLNKHKGLRGCIVACSCGAPLRRQDTRVHGAGGAPRQARVLFARRGTGMEDRNGQEYSSVCRNANPAGAPLPASNAWACRGAPPAPWTRSTQGQEQQKRGGMQGGRGERYQHPEMPRPNQQRYRAA